MEQIKLENKLDRDDRRFLATVEYYGEASTTEIRRRTGMSRSEVNHRFNKLSELNLIHVSRAEHGTGDREPPKVAELTGEARQAIERGILREIDDTLTENEIRDLQSEVRELKEQVEQNQNKVNVLTDSVETLESTVSVLQTDVEFMLGEWADRVEDVVTRLKVRID